VTERTRLLFSAAVAVAVLAISLTGPIGGPQPARAATGKIRHIVVLMMENRSFDNVLGALCAERVAAKDPAPCTGTTTGVLADGSVIPLSVAPDIQPSLNHSHESQLKGLHYVGKVAEMNGFESIPGCQAKPQPGHVPYACYDQYDPKGRDKGSIANITTLANTYAIEDRDFESYTSSSWVAHLQMVAGTRDDFHGDNPDYYASLAGKKHPEHAGWGCQSNKDATWDSPTPGVGTILEPSCVPDKKGNGPYRASSVSYVPTIMDELDAAGLSWSIYVNTLNAARSSCTYFAECYYGPQVKHNLPLMNVLTDGRTGTLPDVSWIIPSDTLSQHPTFSMQEGDNFIGRVVGAISSGSDWSSTAIFLTWDDCGCFYDHVAPPRPPLGIRVPMVIISPWVKRHSVDSTNASSGGVLTFVENTFGLAPLGTDDKAVYDYSKSFDFTQTPNLKPPTMVDVPISAAEQEYLRLHPGVADVDEGSLTPQQKRLVDKTARLNTRAQAGTTSAPRGPG